MKDKMMRVTGELLDNLKTLKSIIGSAPYSDIIQDLVHEKLLKVTAFTSNGYLPIGTVVEDVEGTVLVIDSITDGKVIFNDFSWVLNGGSTCMALKKLSDNVTSLDDRRVKT